MMNKRTNILATPLAACVALGGGLLATAAVGADADAAGAGQPALAQSAQAQSTQAKSAQAQSAQAQSAQARIGTVTPTAFATQAAEGGRAEVQLAELARKQAGSDAVKQFAERMIMDHGKANAELEALARVKNMTLPTPPNAEHKATLKTLQARKGAEFAAAYMAAMKKDHVKTIALFEAATGPTFEDADLKAFATKTLPVLQEHHQLVERIQGQMSQASR